MECILSSKIIRFFWDQSQLFCVTFRNRDDIMSCNLLEPSVHQIFVFFLLFVVDLEMIEVGLKLSGRFCGLSQFVCSWVVYHERCVVGHKFVVVRWKNILVDSEMFVFTQQPTQFTTQLPILITNHQKVAAEYKKVAVGTKKSNINHNILMIIQLPNFN